MNENIKSIAVAGCLNHIGTTTFAIQTVLSIINNDKKAVFLEMNKTEYMEKLLKLYSKAEDHNEFIRFSNIDMYRKEYSGKIKMKNIDYVVKDYGNANLDTFEINSFSEQDLKILVCGSKPNEIFELQKLLSNKIYEDAFFIFSFVPENERLQILPMMSYKAKKTFFSDVIFNPYKLNPNSVEIINQILK